MGSVSNEGYILKGFEGIDSKFRCTSSCAIACDSGPDKPEPSTHVSRRLEPLRDVFLRRHHLLPFCAQQTINEKLHL